MHIHIHKDWMQTGFIQPAVGEEMPADLEQTSKRCEVFTPDITTIVAEMLQRKPLMSSFTLIFQDADENEQAKHVQNTPVRQQHLIYHGPANTDIS